MNSTTPSNLQEVINTTDKKTILIRYLQAFLFIAVYICLGFILKLNPYNYLLIGIPLTLIFQLFIRKQPIQTLWVRDYSKFRLDKWGILIALSFIAFPAKKIVGMIIENELTPKTFIYVAVIVGSLGAAYSLCRFTKQTTRLLLLCFATAGTLGIILFAGVAVARTVALHQSFQPSLLVGIKALLLNFPVAFIVEEVVFRGLIDSHVHEPQQTKGIGSAIFVSVLWGLWHLPIALVSGVDIFVIIFTTSQLILFHTIIGIPLSIYWRKSGNLAVPAFSHGFIDAVRDGLLNNFMR
jgi:membrane protease YdiL (CAAX protease family)